jgi:site-specific recombinase
MIEKYTVNVYENFAHVRDLYFDTYTEANNPKWFDTLRIRKHYSFIKAYIHSRNKTKLLR